MIQRNCTTITFTSTLKFYLYYTFAFTLTSIVITFIIIFIITFLLLFVAVFFSLLRLLLTLLLLHHSNLMLLGGYNSRCSLALHAAAFQPNSCMTSAARKCVASSSSWNMSLNLVRMPSGGPLSMISRRLPSGPMEISCAKDSGLDRATYVASQRSSADINRGNFQWKMRPGDAVTPWRVWRVLAVLMVIGSWRLWTLSLNWNAGSSGSGTSTIKLRGPSCGSIATHPARKSQPVVQSLRAPHSACKGQGIGGRNSVLTL